MTSKLRHRFRGDSELEQVWNSAATGAARRLKGKSIETIEDIASDAVLKYLERQKTEREEIRSPGGFANSMGVRGAIDLLRRKERSPIREEWIDDMPEKGTPSQLAASASRERSLQILTALGDLDAEKLLVFLIESSQLSSLESAVCKGKANIALTHARQRLHRAKVTLRTMCA